MRRDILVIGNFAYGKMMYDGQRVKSRNVSQYLRKTLITYNIREIDLEYFRDRPIYTIFKLLYLVFYSKTIIIMPGKNGLRELRPIMLFAKKALRKKIIYSVIGGWLYEIVNTNKRLHSLITIMDGVFVETKDLKIKLESIGLNNIYHAPNFIVSRGLSLEEIDNKNEDGIYKFVTFSRVTKDKGTTIAIDSIALLNEKYNGRLKCSLDIFGVIDDSYRDEFNLLLATHADTIFYKGVISEKLVETISNYYCLLFPTYYPGEGFPGTLLVSFAAGVPVIASNWKYNSEIVTHLKTGLIFHPIDSLHLSESILWTINNESLISIMRQNCIIEYQNYNPDIILKEMIELIEK